MGSNKRNKKDNQHPHNAGKGNTDSHLTLRVLIERLHLESLPNSTKANLALTALLLLALIVLAAEPALAWFNNIATTICNTFISILSTRPLLALREINVGQEVLVCLCAFILEVFFCPIVVHILDGFKNKRKT